MIEFLLAGKKLEASPDVWDLEAIDAMADATQKSLREKAIQVLSLFPVDLFEPENEVEADKQSLLSFLADPSSITDQPNVVGSLHGGTAKTFDDFFDDASNLLHDTDPLPSSQIVPPNETTSAVTVDLLGIDLLSSTPLVASAAESSDLQNRMERMPSSAAVIDPLKALLGDLFVPGSFQSLNAPTTPSSQSAAKSPTNSAFLFLS